jgi:hypothetical protein
MSVIHSETSLESKALPIQAVRQPLVTLSHFRADGSLMERRLNMWTADDVAILNRTAVWAALNT